jgi:large subunit ribosomal protein L20
MARVKRGSNRRERRKKVLAQSSGYYGNKGNAYRIAKQAVDKSGVNAYRDRRLKKRDFRSLWIVRINAGARLHGMSYSRLIEGLKKAGSEVNRKMLAELAVHDAPAFGELVAAAKAALGSDLRAAGAARGSEASAT